MAHFLQSLQDLLAAAMHLLRWIVDYFMAMAYWEGMTGNLTYDEMRQVCSCIRLGDNISYFPECTESNTIYDMTQHPEGINCEIVMESPPWPLPIQILMTFIFVGLSIVGVIGNLLVVTVVLKVKGMVTPTNCYLVSLAVSDSLFFIATTPTEVMYLFTSNYKFGVVGCAVFTYLPYLCINMSALSITAFTIERYFGICKPYRARQMCTVERAKLILKILWIFSILYNSPWLILSKVIEEDGDSLSCTFRLDRDSLAYKLLYPSDFLFFYMFPMLLNCFIYIKIYFVLISCGDRLKHTAVNLIGGKNPDADGMPATATVAQVPEYQIRGGMGRGSTRSKNSVVKMLACVVIVFATCWLPYRAMVMYNSFATSEEGRWSPEWYIFLSKTLIFINCAINPILYNLMSMRFRNAFKTLLSGNKKKGHGSFSPTMTGTVRAHHTLTVVDSRGRTMTAASNAASRDELKALVHPDTP